MSSRKQDPELSRIRVTAVDSAGRTYSCLTSINGSFELYVPTGDYRVSINQNAIDDDFTLDQNLVLLNLNGNIDAYRISFIIREKERLIKVKKFNSDGTLQQENK